MPLQKKNAPSAMYSGSESDSEEGFEKDEIEKKDEKKEMPSQKEVEEILTWNKGDMPHHLLEESSFEVKFPDYREKYITDAWPAITKALSARGIKAELDRFEGTMTVKTTRETWDPYSIILSRDLITIISRGFDLTRALQILEDGWYYDIIKLPIPHGNNERFVRRRNRLVGPNGNTLKALELLTGAMIVIQGKTVVVMAKTQSSLKTVRQITLDCMGNIHPVYHLKKLMVKRELSKHPDIGKEDWSRFLPKLPKKTNVKNKKVIKKDKKRSLYPQAPAERKVDKMLRTGEYFLTEKQRKEKKLETRKQQSTEGHKKNRTERLMKDTVPPEEHRNKRKRRKSDGEDVSIRKLKKKVRRAKDRLDN